MLRALILAALLSVTSVANAIPSAYNLKVYTKRAELYVSMGQKPHEVAESLNRFYGKSYFSVRSNGHHQTSDIVIIEGASTEITYFATLLTMPSD